MSVKKKGLGRGLNVLVGETFTEAEPKASQDDKNVIEMDINLIEPNKSQPRRVFNEESLKELADSISNYGIIEPIIVKKENNTYMIIAGERRWRAARIAGLHKVPIILKEYTPLEILEISLIENIQREDLNPIEEAETYRRLIEEFGLSQEEIAQKVGRNRSTVSNSVRLLNLDKRVQNFVIENKLTNGHARTLLAIDNNDLQFETAEKIIEENLSVRQTEDLVKKLSDTKDIKTTIPKDEIKTEVELAYKEVEKQFSQILGTKVQILNGRKKGKIEIEYYSPDDLERLLGLIKSLEK